MPNRRPRLVTFYVLYVFSSVVVTVLCAAYLLYLLRVIHCIFQNHFVIILHPQLELPLAPCFGVQAKQVQKSSLSRFSRVQEAHTHTHTHKHSHRQTQTYIQVMESYSEGSQGEIAFEKLSEPMPQEMLANQVKTLAGHAVYVVMDFSSASAAKQRVARVGVLSNIVDGKQQIDFAVSFDQISAQLGCVPNKKNFVEPIPKNNVEYNSITCRLTAAPTAVTTKQQQKITTVLTKLARTLGAGKSSEQPLPWQPKPTVSMGSDTARYDASTRSVLQDLQENAETFMYPTNALSTKVVTNHQQVVLAAIAKMADPRRQEIHPEILHYADNMWPSSRWRAAEAFGIAA